MDESDWDDLRAVLDARGLEAVEHAMASGVPSEIAGRRIAEFNDILIEKLKEKGIPIEGLREREAALRYDGPTEPDSGPGT
jgi:hypothetical protein